ncbi:tRNA-uridine aminocarboxypropyltransferase [Azospirillum agricola]|uniref:tRNA-uridine aminocarboxypropyltransferase n=1 Tax=Azospirillum agricola TaxID=1720247 RepID=UPI000A0F2AF4|nr:tRNA-uridine aminocarboxypropyltransferase [Azospirillum agricola]SMH56966.1 DTW domain-containing protein YfiP [Azospirillum lipoferum]
MHSATAPETCPTCLKPSHLCICEAVEPVENGVFLLILQHPQEKRENLGTAQIAHLQFANSALKVGLSWPNLKRILGREVDYKRWGVLYLGPVKPDNPAARSEIAVVDRNGVPQKDSELVLGDLEGIIVLDGTWSQAKTLWWRNAWLLKCRRIVLHPNFRSLYGQARKEPRRESVSTLEAGAFVLSRLEGEPAILDRALKPFSLLLKKIRAPRPRPVLPPRTAEDGNGMDEERDEG